MNTGKVFEQNFKKSVPGDFYYLRLKDPAVGWTGSTSKYSPNNPFDCLIYTSTGLHCIELKTCSNSITFWREDFEHDGKKHTFEIKKHQIEGLEQASMFPNVYAGLVINFRSAGETYYLPIQVFTAYINVLDKKSINDKDAHVIGYPVPVTKFRVNERYDIRAMTEVVEHGGR